MHAKPTPLGPLTGDPAPPSPLAALPTARFGWTVGCSVVLAWLLIALVGNAIAMPWLPDPASMSARHLALQPQLASSPFGRPIVLEAAESSKQPHGDVYAELKHGFADVLSSLQRWQTWCDVMLLQTNVKACSSVPGAAVPTLRVGFVRKPTQTVDDAQFIDFKYAMPAATRDYLSLQMTADTGPVGTSNYHLQLEAIPLDTSTTFVHLSYDYANGVVARLATDAYLATLGRNKVGFSISGRDDSGQPVFVRGVRGMAERSAMRYYLAVEAVLASAKQPAAQQPEDRLQHWWSAIERYPRQLKEMERADYLAMKRRELQLPER